jgi:N-acetylneuraminic acid mutarotase
MKKTILIIWILCINPLSLAVEGVWTQKADMPTARGYLSTSVVNGKIYAIGGGPSALQAGVSTVEEYDPTTDSWTRKADMPTPRWSLSTSVVNGKIYAIGGAQGSPKGLRTVEEYDPATDSWTLKANMLTPRFTFSTSAVNGKIYAMGGGVPTGSQLVEEYDPVTDTWTRKASMPTGKYGFFTSALNGKIYAIGGVTSYPDISPRVEEYDPVTDTWTRKANMLTARAYAATSVVNGQIYAIGGAEPHPDNPPIPTVEVYDPETDTWTTEADMPIPKTVFSTSVVNGKIYAIGGSPAGFPWGSALATVEEYEPYPLIVDLNGDGIVDSVDMCIMLDNWGTDNSLCDIGPMPWGDGIVDVQDLIVLAGHLKPLIVAHYKLDEMTGDIARDNSIDGHDATIHGEPVWQSTGGKVAGALELDGIDDYIKTPFILNPGSGSFGVFAWVKGDEPDKVIISQTGNFGDIWLSIDPSGKLMTGFSGMYFGDLASETIVNDGQWHHVGFVYDMDSFHRVLYVDGILVAEDATVVSGMPSDGGLYVGASKELDTGSFFSGLIDDVRIYDRALTAEEIAALSQ